MDLRVSFGKRPVDIEDEAQDEEEESESDESDGQYTPIDDQSEGESVDESNADGARKS